MTSPIFTTPEALAKDTGWSERLIRMREPTDEVWEIMNAHASNGMVNWDDYHNAMIDAALKTAEGERCSKREQEQPMARKHDLKIWSDFYDDVASGKKPFEFRLDDRMYDVGDTLHLEEFRPAVGTYTGRFVDVLVTYVLRNTRNTEKIGLPKGYCILGIKLKEPETQAA